MLFADFNFRFFDHENNQTIVCVPQFPQVFFTRFLLVTFPRTSSSNSRSVLCLPYIPDSFIPRRSIVGSTMQQTGPRAQRVLTYGVKNSGRKKSTKNWKFQLDWFSGEEFQKILNQKTEEHTLRNRVIILLLKKMSQI